MNRYIIITLFAACTLSAGAQVSIDDVLHSVEANNKTLKANQHYVAARKIEAKLDNNLADPTVTYTHQYGNKEGLGIQGELIAEQWFDFPTVYAQRSQLSRAKGKTYDSQGAELRQQILLQAKGLCIDLIYLNQQRSMLQQRLQNAEQLSSLYAKRLNKGDANILEVNKIDLELLNARNEARMNETAREAKLHELTVLNGDSAILFADTVYPLLTLPQSFADLRQEALPANKQLLSLQSEKMAALRQVDVSKAKGLPGVALGYRLNTAAGGERFNGFLVGLSIPLFSNHNRVKQAKAQTLFTDMQLESATSLAENDLLRLYNRSMALKTSIDEYSSALKNQNNLALLNKAIMSGQISMIEYFADVTTLYQSLQNYMQLQNEYQKVMAELYKFRL